MLQRAEERAALRGTHLCSLSPPSTNTIAPPAGRRRAACGVAAWLCLAPAARSTAAGARATGGLPRPGARDRASTRGRHKAQQQALCSTCPACAGGVPACDGFDGARGPVSLRPALGVRWGGEPACFSTPRLPLTIATIPGAPAFPRPRDPETFAVPDAVAPGLDELLPPAHPRVTTAPAHSEGALPPTLAAAFDAPDDCVHPVQQRVRGSSEGQTRSTTPQARACNALAAPTPHVIDPNVFAPHPVCLARTAGD